MKYMPGGVTKIAATFALAGGFVGWSVLPANAATHQSGTPASTTATTVAPAFTTSARDNYAFGSESTGPIAAGPFGFVTSVPLPQTSLVRNVNITPLLSTGLTYDSAGDFSAFSRVSGSGTPSGWVEASVDGTQLVTPQASSTCRINQFGGLEGYANLINGGSIRYDGRGIGLPQHPFPDTVIPVPDGTITLNRQTFVDGTLTVDAVYVDITTGPDAGQTLTIAESSCTFPLTVP